MSKITQKQLLSQLTDAFASGSVAQLNSVLKLGSQNQINAVYHSDLWTKTVAKHSVHLTPHKAYSFAKSVSKRFGFQEPFQIFVENCAPLHVYVSGIKFGEKPSVVSTVQSWVRDSSMHAEAVFVLLNEKLDPAVAKMTPQDFLGKNDVWWPSVAPSLMQTVANVQPDFVKDFQKTLVGNLPDVCVLLNSLTAPTSEPDAHIGSAISSAMIGDHPYLFILMRDHLQDILLNSLPTDSVAHNLAICMMHAQIHITLVALQTWNTHACLDNECLINIHQIVAGLDDVDREKIATYSDIHLTDFLNLCQGAHIHNQVGSVSPTVSPRKI